MKNKLKISDIKKLSHLEPFVLPGLLSLLLIVTMLSAYDVKPFSPWLLVEVLIVCFAFAVGNYTVAHKKKGGALVFVLAVLIIMTYVMLATAGDGGSQFFQWFLTGAEVVSNKGRFILAVILAYGSFFAIVIFYFSCVLYRGFFLMLISVIPLVLHTKVLSDVHIAYVCLIAVLNVAIYAYNIRKANNVSGKIVGVGSHILSMAIFLGIVLSLAGMMPKRSEAKYYSIFENLFMGGNLSLKMPEEFSVMNEYSGNADDFNNLANRRLYVIYGEENVYLKRQTFDYYDFEKDAWYADEYYSEPAFSQEEASVSRVNLSLKYLQKAISNRSAPFRSQKRHSSSLFRKTILWKVSAPNRSGQSITATLQTGRMSAERMKKSQPISGRRIPVPRS